MESIDRLSGITGTTAAAKAVLCGYISPEELTFELAGAVSQFIRYTGPNSVTPWDADRDASLGVLEVLTSLERTFQKAKRIHIEQARHAGASWGSIAAHTGMTEQAAVDLYASQVHAA